MKKPQNSVAFVGPRGEETMVEESSTCSPCTLETRHN